MRDIKIHLPHDHDTLHSVAEKNHIPIGDMFNVLGYLVGWAVNAYDTVEITVAADGDIGAFYTVSSNADRKYYLHAVWSASAQQYGVHS